MFDTPAAVAKNFIRCKCPYYLITDSKGNKLWWNDEEDDIEAAAELLQEDLKQIRQGNTGVYIIHHFKTVPKAGFKKGVESDCTSTFKKPLYDEYERNEYRQNYQSRVLDAIQGIDKRLQDIEQKQILEDSIPDDELEDEVEPNDWFGRIMGNPYSREMAMNFMNSIAANLSTNLFQSQQKPLSMAGTNQPQNEVTLEAILEKLFALGITPQDLYLISQKPQAEINFLLSMLRK